MDYILLYNANEAKATYLNDQYKKLWADRDIAVSKKNWLEMRRIDIKINAVIKEAEVSNG